MAIMMWKKGKNGNEMAIFETDEIMPAGWYDNPDCKGKPTPSPSQQIKDVPEDGPEPPTEDGVAIEPEAEPETEPETEPEGDEDE